jgi:uncharacterized protein (TIGR03790 family)
LCAVAGVTRAVLLLFCAVSAMRATESVLLVVNQRSALSRSTGEYYARKRSIPVRNLCFIQSSDEETANRDGYLKEIEAPVAACLKSRGLTEKVLYIVLTAGVPIRVRGKVAPGGDNASVDSELTLLYGKIHGAKYPLNGIVPNPLFGKTTAVFRHPEFPIYLVTRLAAYDFPGVRALIDRSLLARNRGTFVIDARSSEDAEGDAWLKNAALRLPSDRTVFDETSKVLYDEKNVIAYAGWGSNDRNRTRRRLGFRWLPGAIVTDFVSTNARTFARPPDDWNISFSWDKKALWFAGAPQSLITDYLDEGATGAAGHVDEPYLGLAPRPEHLLPAWYAGRNLAESYYLSIPGLSWQNIVVGDPLCSLGPPKK